MIDGNVSTESRLPLQTVRATHLIVLTAAVMAVLVTAPPGARAQESSDTADTQGQRALRVFFDCSGRNCNSTYYRTEIDWVNWVRDRTLAQVHLIMTSQTNASNGREYGFDFIGLQELEGVDDALGYASLGSDTSEENLSGISQVLAIGLARYSVLAGSGEGLEVQRSGASRDLTDRLVTGDDVEDPWNFWVFNVGLNGNYDEESSENEARIRGNMSASRTTTTWKFRVSGFGSYSREELELSDGSTVLDTRSNWNLNQELVHALADHWSVAFESEASASTRSNQDFGIEVGPGIEYSYWPYEEAPRRSFTFTYRVNVQYFDWEEETEFFKTSETRPGQRFEARLFQRQAWGDSWLSVETSSFLDDVAQNRIELNGNISIRVFRGLRFNAGAGWERIRDQIFLPLEGLTDEEILLRRRERASEYEFDLRMGFSYQFGSIFNNVVNNRF